MGVYVVPSPAVAASVFSGGDSLIGLTLQATNPTTQAAYLMLVPSGQADGGIGMFHLGPPVLASPPGASDNALFVANQFPPTLTSAIDAYMLHARGFLPNSNGSGSAAGYKVARFHVPAAGTTPYTSSTYTGAGGIAAVEGQIDQGGGGVNPIQGTAGNWFAGNIAGAFLSAGATGTGWNVGVLGRAKASSKQNWGLLGVAASSANNASCIGVVGTAKGTGTGQTNIGVFATLQSAEPGTMPPSPGAALVADNAGITTNDVAQFYTNSVLAAKVDSAGRLLATGFGSAIATKAANYTVTAADSTIVASGVGTTITLPSAPPNGFEVTIKRNDASNTITVSRGGTDVIELAGATATTRSLGSNGASISLVYDAGTWFTYGTQGTVT